MVLYSVLHPVQVVLFALQIWEENKRHHKVFLIKEIKKMCTFLLVFQDS